MRKFILFFLIICCSSGFSDNLDEDYSIFNKAEETIFVCIPSLSWRIGNGRSYNQGFETAECFFFRADQTFRSYPFLDIRLNRVDEGKLASNLGVGWRFFDLDYFQLLGANLFYDFRHFTQDNLHQLGIGIELFNDYFELRANSYMPFGEKKVLLEEITYAYPGGYFANVKKYDAAKWGMDFEIGRELFSYRFFELYGGIGPYYYGSKSCSGSIFGGMARIAAYFSNYLSLEFFFTHDALYNSKAQAEIKLYIPFSSQIPFFESLFIPLQRNPIILVDRVCCWKTNF